jgi:hypothetical protein
MVSHNNLWLIMWWIDIDDAVRIYARMLRARLGSRRGVKAARQMADHLRAKGDWSGVKAWEAVAAELTPSNQGDRRQSTPGA